MRKRGILPGAAQGEVRWDGQHRRYPALRRLAGELLRLGGWMALVALCGLLLAEAVRSIRLGQQSAAAGVPGGGSAEAEEETALTKGARVAWQGFLEARSVEEQLPHVLRPDRWGAALRRRWEGGRPDPEATVAARVLRVPLPADDRVPGRVILEWLPEEATPADGPLVLYFQDTSAGVKLDWETYRQQRDRSLERFLTAVGGAGEEEFRVGLLRRHVFGDLAAAAGDGLVVKLATLAGTGMDRLLVVPPGGPGRRELEAGLAWDQVRVATLRLGWQRFPDGRRRLELRKFAGWNVPDGRQVPENK